MEQTKTNKTRQIPDYLVFLVAPLVFLILIPFTDVSGKVGIFIIAGSTLALMAFRYLNKEKYYSESVLMTRVTIAYFLILFIGNLLVFKSLFDSAYVAIAVSISVLTANVLALKVKGAARL